MVKKLDRLLKKLRGELRQAFKITGHIEAFLADPILLRVTRGYGVPLLPPYSEITDDFLNLKHDGAKYFDLFSELLDIEDVYRRLIFITRLLELDDTDLQKLNISRSKLYQLMFYAGLQEVYNFDQLLETFLKHLSRNKSFTSIQREGIKKLQKEIRQRGKIEFQHLLTKRGEHTHKKSYLPEELVRFRWLEAWGQESDETTVKTLTHSFLKRHQANLKKEMIGMSKACNRVLNHVSEELHLILFP